MPKLALGKLHAKTAAWADLRRRKELEYMEFAQLCLAFGYDIV